MCGILFTNRPGIEREDFISALNSMAHRGPDATGCYQTHGFAQLGHNRLSILDLNARSNQPFYSRDNRYAIVFNGEIYNYQELAQQHRLELRTASDTELLGELFRIHGPKM